MICLFFLVATTFLVTCSTQPEESSSSFQPERPHLLIMTDFVVKSGKSPVVTDISWGKVVVQDPDDSTNKKVYKDVKLYPGGARVWDWNETGTKHSPGTQVADVEELVLMAKVDTTASSSSTATATAKSTTGGNRPDVVILSKGMEEVLKVQDSTVKYLEEAGIEVHVEQTRKAIELYNELQAQGRNVAAIIHSTC